MSKFYRIVKAVLTPIFLGLYRVKYVGEENLPSSGGYIMCCNHTSNTDVIFLSIGSDRQIHYMAKQELFKSKILGFVLSKLGAFMVKRGTGGTDALNKATEIVKRGDVMGIFPEGKRYFDGPPRNAKSGISVVVANTNATVVPVSIYHEGKIKLFDKVTVRYGKPVSSEEIGMKDDSRNELRRVSTLLMDKITEQWELGY